MMKEEMMENQISHTTTTDTNTNTNTNTNNNADYGHSPEIKIFEETPGPRAPFDSSLVPFNYNHGEYHQPQEQQQQKQGQERFALLDNPEIVKRRRPSLPPPTIPLIIHLGNPSNTAAIMSGTNKNTLSGKRRPSAGNLSVGSMGTSDTMATPTITTPTTTATTSNSAINASTGNIAPIKAILADDPKTQKKKGPATAAGSSGAPPSGARQGVLPPRSVGLFSHLAQHERSLDQRTFPANIHSAIIKFALRSAAYLNLGSSLRCREMLLAFREAIQSGYRANPESAICRHLDLWVKPMVGVIVEARPMAIAMANAIRALRHQISLLPPEISETEARDTMIRFIDTFISNRLDVAHQLIIQFALAKISDGDVILTYGHCRVVEQILLAAAAAERRFRVIVVDGRPFHEGKTLAKELVAAGISCDLVNINALAYMMREVTKAIIGAAGLYANGTMLSRVGTAMVCALSNRSNVPVIVVCETVKFSDRSQIDSFVFNELGDPDSLVLGTPNGANGGFLKGWREIPSLQVLNILYDVTPAEYITMVITEIGMIPVTSVPVVLREYTSSSAILGHSHSHSHSHHHHHHHHTHTHSHHHHHNHHNHHHHHHNRTSLSIK